MYTREYIFNQHDTFVTCRIFKSAGKTYTGGMVFEKDTVSVRRLRQMYETGFIRPVAAEKEAVVEETAKPDNEPVPEVSEDKQDEVAVEPEVAEAVEGEAAEVVEEVATEEVVAEEKRKPGRPKGSK